MDSDMHIASYPQLQLIQRQHLHRIQQANTDPRPRASSLLLSPVASAWRASNAAAGLGIFPSPPVGAPAHGTVGTYADLVSQGNLHPGASLAQRGGNRVDPLFNPQNTSNVYINGLPTYFSTSQLFDLCAEFGPIASVRTFDRLNTPEPSTYGFVLFEDVESARRCIVALRQYSDLHPSFAKTQKIPQSSSDTQFNDIHTKRMQRLQLFDNATQFLGSNAPTHTLQPQTQPLPQPEQLQDETWRARVASAPVVMQGAPSTGRPKFGGARSSLETVLEDPSVMPEAQADVFVQGLPLHLQPYELEALFAPHKIMDSRVCQVPGVGGLPDSISGVMRLSSLAVAREILNKLDGLRFPGWSHSLQITVIDSKNSDEDTEAAFEVQPSRAPSGVGLGVSSIRSAAQAFSGRRVVSAPVGSGAGVESNAGFGGGVGPGPVGTMASIYAPRVDAGVPRRSPSAVASDIAPIYSTGSAVGSERSSPMGSERPVLPPLQLAAAFSPRARSGSNSSSDGSMSPVSPALTFTSVGRTPTVATIATPRYDGEEGVKIGAGLNVKGGHDGEDVGLTALAVGLAGLDD
ncbi:hypothetical protein BDV93DRAFT_558070 [Ceratobasidium sp. AG-I]|nr:hypothetical protein BDV93DRAFT_558070 [Ceratobasidium sp. AG-I]